MLHPQFVINVIMFLDEEHSTAKLVHLPIKQEIRQINKIKPDDMAPVQRSLTCSNSLILNCTCLQDLKSHDTVQIHTKNSKVGQPEANELQMILKTHWE